MCLLRTCPATELRPETREGILSFSLLFISLVCVCAHARMPQPLCGDQKKSVGAVAPFHCVCHLGRQAQMQRPCWLSHVTDSVDIFLYGALERNISTDSEVGWGKEKVLLILFSCASPPIPGGLLQGLQCSESRMWGDPGGGVLRMWSLSQNRNFSLHLTQGIRQ